MQPGDPDPSIQTALHDAAARALAAVGRAGAELSLLLVDDAEIRALNAQWRGKDSATDVLSFPSGGPEGLPVDVLGDVVISVDTARRQAAERGHSVEVELRVLLAHGLAHLLGHDHGDPAQAAAMAAVEAALLAPMFDGRAPEGLVALALSDDDPR